MGRKKSYCREETAERALQTFWEQGYARTSLRDLEQATGVNRYGLYDSFEDKEGLFVECLEQYSAGMRARFDELAPRGLDGLLELLGRYAEPGEAAEGCKNGCLVVSSLLESDELSGRARAALEGHVAALLDFVRAALRTEREAGRLRTELDLEECAEFVHLALVGLPTMARIAGRDDGARLAARSTLRTIESWRS
jgi:AcrR family transcriptional regulator